MLGSFKGGIQPDESSSAAMVATTAAVMIKMPICLCLVIVLMPNAELTGARH